ncbi:MAG: TonB family protein, partial [Candidatus Aminicenantales bacterium]
PRIKYTGSPVAETARAVPAPSGARVVLRTPGPTPERPPAGEAGGGGGEEAPGGEGVPLGGVSGQLIGGYDRDKEDDLISGFSLVYPADAMRNLDKYAKVPEDAWLRPLRKLAHPPADFSRYLHPRSGTREAAAVNAGRSGGPGGAPGGIGALKSPPAGVVAAYVPENVKMFDLSGWASTILNAVQKNWTLGADAWSAEWTGLVTIKILVMKSGELNGIDVTASSNIDILDASARRAIDRSRPWPALPDDFPDTSLEIQMVFRYGR